MPSFRQKRRQRRPKNPARRKRIVGVVGRVVACIFLLALLCVPPLFVNSAIGYMPAIFFLLMLLLCFVFTRVAKRCLVFDEVAENVAVTRGDATRVFLRIKNTSPLFVPKVSATFTVKDLFGADARQDEFVFAVNPLAMEDFDFDIGFNHIGEFTVGLKQLQVHDFLGLFHATLPVVQEQSILVVPRLRPITDVTFSETSVQQVTEANRPSQVEGTDYSTVRDYVPGDPIKTIHWKLSARSSNYLTKVFEDHSNPQLDIYLDTAAPQLPADELMDLYDATIEMAISLRDFAHSNGLDARIMFINATGEPEQFVMGVGQDFRDLMYALPVITPSADSYDFHQMMLRCATSTAGADNVAVCSSLIDRDLCEVLARIHATQRNVAAYALQPSATQEQVRAANRAALRTLQNIGVNWFALDTTFGGEQRA